MEETPDITALVITLNEADRMDSFLSSLSFAKEIIIVDSFSTDDTVTIAEGFPNVKVIQRPFNNFSDQKNFAIEQANCEWIVFFDPDEEITPALETEIRRAVEDPKADAYVVRREFYFMGKKIRYSGYQTDWIIRLFRKGSGQYDGSLVHETLQVNGRVARFKTCMPHHSYKSLDDYTNKLRRYSGLQAQKLYARGEHPTLYHFLIRPAYRFWHQYLLRLGILDGKEGFILAYLNATTVFDRYTQLLLLHRGIK